MRQKLSFKKQNKTMFSNPFQVDAMLVSISYILRKHVITGLVCLCTFLKCKILPYREVGKLWIKEGYL